jgi:hypothetical protein
MNKWTCASCGQEVASHQPIYKCAVCLQTEAIEDQTRLLRQIHNVPEQPEYPDIDWEAKRKEGLATLLILCFCIFMLFVWLSS